MFLLLIVLIVRITPLFQRNLYFLPLVSALNIERLLRQRKEQGVVQVGVGALGASAIEVTPETSGPG